MPKKAAYTNDSISSLKGAERVRKRPGVIFGSDGLEGCQHSVLEILANAIDEAREGYGSEIIVTRYNNCVFEVEDFGRGCPVDWNESEGRFNWELVFCDLYAGGKYDNAEGESYEFSLGLNGLGSCATQYASAYMDVTVYRDGKKYTLRFEKGEIVGELKSEPHTGKRTGTIIRWKPDLEVFTDINVPVEYFTDTLKRQSVVNPKLRFRLRTEKDGGGFDEVSYRYENGIADYVAEVAGEDALTKPAYFETERKGRDRSDKPEYKVKIAASFCVSNRANLIEYYHNSSWLEHGGAPEKASRSAFVSAFDAYLKKNNKYLKNESKISWNDIADCLILVTSSFSSVVSYENQTKKAITNKFIQEATTEFLREQLGVWFLENPADATRAADQALINKRSREKAEEARLNIKKKLSGGLDISNRVEKFIDCRTRDTSQREIYIVEGDSALGACKLARDPEFQGVVPLSGKPINCLKADISKIYGNSIITDLIRVLGCGVELHNKHTRDLAQFDLDALRWARVILCTDADVDGYHIRTLLITMLYRLTPTLIERGYVHIAESPLFEITRGEKTYFAYTEREKNEIVAGFDGAKHTIQRSKGLGENDPGMMWLTTMNPATRRLIRVMPEDAERTADAFKLLMGDNLAGRKDFITEHGYEYIELADV